MRARVIGAALTATLAVAVGAGEATGAAASGARSLSKPGVQSHFAFVDRAVVARSAPSGAARSVGRLRTRTQDGTDELVGVLASRFSRGQEWLKVQLPVRPSGQTGWIPRGAVGELRTTPAWVKVDVDRQRLTLVRAGKVVLTASVGVGKARWPTTRGSFYVRNRLVPTSPDGTYGALAFGTSARSEVLTDWPGGGFIGIHGTNQPGLLPGRVSHGCIRMRNEDILRLDPLMPVGTPVTIT